VNPPQRRDPELNNVITEISITKNTDKAETMPDKHLLKPGFERTSSAVRILYSTQLLCTARLLGSQA